jgi:APA family basic amino acid/polyamine antiporter
MTSSELPPPLGHDGPGGRPHGSLLRILGVGSIVGIVVGTMIGSGIFIVPATVAGQVRSPLLMLAVWVAGGVLSVFGALSLAELASAYSEAGGLYVYLREAYGPLAGFLFGWTLFLVIDSGSIAALSSAFATKYLPHFVDMTPLAGKGAAVLFILVLMAVNVLGVRRGALVQNVLTSLKFAALAGIVVAVFFFAPGRWGNLAGPAPAGAAGGGGLISAFGLALVAALWAYKGFECSTYSSGETRNPSRTLPLGIIAGCGLVTLLYLLANAAYLYVLPAAAIARSDRVAADAMNIAVGPFGASVVSVIILFSIMGAANGHILTGPRVYYAMAKDGLFFRAMASVHPRFRTPHVSILVVGGWSILLGMSGTFEQLLRYVIFGHWIFMGLAVSAVFVLRKKRPDLVRPYRALGYPVTPGLFVLAAVFVTVNALIGTFWNSFAGLAIIALGIPAYLYWKGRKARARALR